LSLRVEQTAGLLRHMPQLMGEQWSSVRVPGANLSAPKPVLFPAVQACAPIACADCRWWIPFDKSEQLQAYYE